MSGKVTLGFYFKLDWNQKHLNIRKAINTLLPARTLTPGNLTSKNILKRFSAQFYSFEKFT